LLNHIAKDFVLRSLTHIYELFHLVQVRGVQQLKANEKCANLIVQTVDVKSQNEWVFDVQ